MGGQDEEILQFQANLRRINEGYVMFILCTVGVMGNILAFLTFSSKLVRNTTTSLYLRALAIADIIVLTTAVFRYKTYKLFLDESHELDTVFHFDAYSEVYIEPLHWIALGSSSFITIALSFERYLAVRFPLIIKRKCTTCTVMLCIFLVVGISVVISIPNYFSYKLVHFNFFGEEIAVATLTDMGKSSLYPCIYHNYLIPVLWYIIPAALLSVINILLIFLVQKSSRIRVGVPNTLNSNRKLTVMIIFILLVYIICNLPKCIFMFYKIVNQMTNKNECTDITNKIDAPQTKAYLIIEVITELLNVLNSCLNFCVYCLVGTRFRTELVRILLCRWMTRQDLVLINGSYQTSSIRRGATS
ncbi:probable G-protein coupled receptor B0563.6 [Ruditapes philippinarum]|uniref:probable G-protein coupled receptor B0563.6 n=1 Tax=Ruditapes philippinarum TaxID=129788 RepID=UPI00295B0733|nr:probable G-protein coupled receptor B0563.6 [Ruditapes philippinarum]